ncbi:hypothetical protein I350_01806 [Cryptococcus amylolentus CBS 6273]|uniref:Peptidase A1 domain-containing protein n=1 Tax=Cryptococcus amylolentus CBS 6273 TaxID=1296118 RepID=A0A1E3KFY3_9TREE|nr:hypothetical protein I350_01806 [Cryptococcus amylolentus CBS 6273]
MLPLLALLPFLALTTALPAPTDADVAPESTGTAVTSKLPLKLLASRQYSDSLVERQAWLKHQAKSLQAKYALSLDEEWKKLIGMSKRDSGSVQLEDLNYDGTYAGTVSIGTPAQDLLLVLDTGSSDLWAAGSGCSADFCQDVETFNKNASTSYQKADGTFRITYGSGSAAGDYGTDVVDLAGFSLANTTFAVVDQATSGLIDEPLSGIMGFGWTALASSKASPWWETLASTGQWDDPEFGVYMARFRGVDSATSDEKEGGEITFGGVDSSKYSGDLNYISIDDSAKDYWRIAVDGLSVNGDDISISSPQAAIDTGTTLIGAPSSTISSIYAQIPNSEPLDSSVVGSAGYYQFPCNTTVSVKFTFGGQEYEMDGEDMNLGSFTDDESMCTGAFFEQQMSSRSPVQWIVGAAFLKNVYTAFRYEPTAIGFAALVANGTSS